MFSKRFTRACELLEDDLGIYEEEKVNEEYHGMEYPLEQLPDIWFKLAAEVKANAKEIEMDDPQLAHCFRHRAIAIFACAEQLKWALAQQKRGDS